MMIQIVRLVNNCFNLELELKKAGSTTTKLLSYMKQVVSGLLKFFHIKYCL